LPSLPVAGRDCQQHAAVVRRTVGKIDIVGVARRSGTPVPAASLTDHPVGIGQFSRGGGPGREEFPFRSGACPTGCG